MEYVTYEVLTSHNLLASKTQRRIELNYAAENLAANRPDLPAFLKQANNFAQDLFWRARDNIFLEIDTTNESKDRNHKRVEQILVLMTEKVNNQTHDFKNVLKEMTQQQQNEALTFWSDVAQFFINIFQWLMDVFVYAINRIRVGCSIDKDAINGLFDMVCDWLNKLFE